MQIKPIVQLRFNHNDLHVIRSALQEMPYGTVAGLMGRIDAQLSAPENLVQDDRSSMEAEKAEPMVEDDRGAGETMTGTDAD